MTFSKSKSRFIRIAPRKARLAAGLIRGKDVENARLQLMNSNLRGARLLKKTLDSAVANAETQLDAKRTNLKVHEVRVDAGPILKRAKGKSRGGRVPINKRTSHFTVVLTIGEEKK